VIVLRTITLENLSPDVLIRVLIALEGCSTQDFATKVGASYRSVLDVSRGFSPCGYKLSYLLAIKYQLHVETILSVAHRYNCNLKGQSK
jgi:hypothetical protein